MPGVLDAKRPNDSMVLNGDTHPAWAANLLADFADPSSNMEAAEFVCTSISSTFLGVASPLAPEPGTAKMRTANRRRRIVIHIDAATLSPPFLGVGPVRPLHRRSGRQGRQTT